MKSRKSGFILLIVIGLLGVMAVLAMTLVNRSKSSLALSQYSISMAQAKLMARSGVEYSIFSYIGDVSGNVFEPVTGKITNRSFSGVAQVLHDYSVYHRDASGCLNINDGITAGKLEMGAGYDAGATDPWIIPNSPTPELSAWCNIRIRRLLNAYGDAHRFVEDVGLPEWNELVPASDPTYSVSFVATCTAKGDRFTPQAAPLTGLGDLIISQRPTAGYRSLEDIRDICNSWAATNVTNWPYPGTFFDRVSADFTVDAFEDTSFLRMVRAPGLLDASNVPNWNNDFTDGRVDMEFLDSNPPDMTPSTLWETHPISVINFNSASLMVKTAIFASMANVDYVCEGMGVDMLTNANNGNIPQSEWSPRPSVGVGGPVFRSANMTENGVDISSTDEKNAFMSMRDALVLAQALENEEDVQGGIQSFRDFEDRLRDLKAMKAPYERADSTSDPIPRYENGANANFDQVYVEKTLPRVLSLSRALPGWFHAPISMLNPILQEGGGPSNSLPSVDMALRSAEDFVWKVYLPKIRFAPGGTVLVRSTGRHGARESFATQSIDVTAQAFQVKHIKTQAEFELVTDTGLSSADIKIGPEPSGVDASIHLGVVGLEDRVEVPTGPRPRSIHMSFSGNLDESAIGTLNYPPQDPANDNFSYNNTGGVGYTPPVVVEDLPQAWKDMGYALPIDPSTMPFNAALMAELRAGTPTDLITWRRPRNPTNTWDMLFGMMIFFGPLPGPYPTSETEWRDWLETNWGALGCSVPWPGSGASSDELMWYSLTSFYAWSGWGAAQSNVWSNGTPGTPGGYTGSNYQSGPMEQDRTHLVGSAMEGPDASLFAPGSTGTNLSPFGGLMFHSWGHGTRATVPYSDSLYWRPQVMLGATDLGDPISDLPGKIFNRAFVSMWYRMPSGYQYRRNSYYLMNLTLWQRMQMMMGHSAFGGTLQQFPVPFEIRLKLSESRMRFEHGSWDPDHLVISNQNGSSYWSYDVDAPVQPIPAGILNPTNLAISPNPPADPGPDENNLMPPYTQVVQDELTWLSKYSPYRMRWSGSQVQNNYTNGAPSRHQVWPKIYRSSDLHTVGRLPGTWNRVAVAWNLRAHTTDEDDYYHPADLTGGTAMVRQVVGQPISMSETDQMLLIIGEKSQSFNLSQVAAYPFGSNLQMNWSPQAGNDPPVRAIRTDNTTYPSHYPMGRFNSLIDNIDIRFESTNGSTHRTTDPTPASIIEGDADYKTKRYGLTLQSEAIMPATEPALVLNPALPGGATVLMVSARIFDVPDLGALHNSPWIKLEVQSSDAGWGTTGTANPGTVEPFISQSWTTLNGLQADSTLRIHLTWRATDPNDVLYLNDGLCDIPWIEEVSVIYSSGTPELRSWSVN